MSGRFGRVAPWWRRFKRNGYKRDRCAHCGHPFRWSRDARFATGNRDGKVFHGPCQSYLIWRAKADARLAVLGKTAELAGIDGGDVCGALSLSDGSGARNLAWSVFYDLKKTATTEADQ